MLPWTFLPAEFTVSLLSMVLGFVSRLCEGVARRASCEQTASGWSIGRACHHPNICADPGRSMGCAFHHPALNHAWCSCGLQGTSLTSNVLILGSSCWKQLAHSRHVMTLVMVLSAGLDGSRPYDFRLCEGIASRASCKWTASGWSVGCACHHPIVLPPSRRGRSCLADPGRHTWSLELWLKLLHACSLGWRIH